MTLKIVWKDLGVAGIVLFITWIAVYTIPRIVIPTWEIRDMCQKVGGSAEPLTLGVLLSIATIIPAMGYYFSKNRFDLMHGVVVLLCLSAFLILGYVALPFAYQILSSVMTPISQLVHSAPTNNLFAC